MTCLLDVSSKVQPSGRGNPSSILIPPYFMVNPALEIGRWLLTNCVMPEFFNSRIFIDICSSSVPIGSTANVDPHTPVVTVSLLMPTCTANIARAPLSPDAADDERAERMDYLT